jgi:hypothetical protein
MHTSFIRAPFALALAATLAASYVGASAPARADDETGAPPSYATSAPPAVARLAVVEGQVALKHGDDSEQAAAGVNAPIVAGDYITTGDDGHAEVQLDGANIVRAGADTQLRFTQLDGANDVTQIAQGTVEVRVFASGQGSVQVQTPSVDVEPSEAGEYLITVTSDGNSQITARSGSLAVVTPQGTQQVVPGRTMVVAGEAANAQYQYIDEVAQTDVEAWGDQRDQMLASAQSAQSPYVSSDVTGSADLNQYGNWVDIPGYGNAWVPNDVAPGWSPYSNGSWVSLNYYGPTWVAAEPWGWAPYHYGRWFFAPTVGWAWTPGSRSARPVWSPALVAFFGFGGGGGGVGFGNVGWVPLAPGESYRPWWGRGASLSLGVSFNSYRNYAHGFVGVPYATWQHGVIDRAHPMSTAELQSSHFYQGSLSAARMGLGARYSSRSLASNLPKPQYQRFNAIGSYPSSNRPFVNRAGTASAWQGFSGGARAAIAPRSQGYGAASQGYGAPSQGWQRFNGGTQQRSGYQSYQQPQRQYQSYPQQRQYQSYPQQRQYGGYQTQRQYQSYAGQRQYAAPQRQYQSYRPQQSSRSAPSRTGNSGGHPRGPGRP